jgi:hypothetical protein
VEAVPLAETDNQETQMIVHNNKHNIRLELRQNNELRLCEDDYGAEVKHQIESDEGRPIHSQIQNPALPVD